MRGYGPLGAAARGPQGPDLDGCAGPPGNGRGADRASADARRFQVSALGCRAGFPLGQAPLAWWLALCGPLAAAPNGGARDKACSYGPPA